MEKSPEIKILLNLPESYLPKAEYVFRHFCAILRLKPKFIYGAQKGAAHIYYGMPPKRDYPITIHFEPKTAEFFEQGELYPMEEVNFREFRGEKIPFLFSRGGEIYSFNKQNTILNKDIIAAAFYFLTCWQEQAPGLDIVSQGRADYKKSIQHRRDFVEMPVVDVYAQILENAIKRSAAELPFREKSFALALSHDIDYWNYWSHGKLGEVMRYNLRSFAKRPLNALYKLLGHGLHKGFVFDHYRLLEAIVKKEEELGVASTWFIMGKDDYPDARQNYIKEPKARAEIVKLLGERDVGLHGSPEAAYDMQALLEQKRNLEELGLEPKGFRTHYLHFDYQASLNILEEAGFAYDSTLGYWESIGFRCGTSLPFYPYNLKEDRAFKVLEIPLAMMDTSMRSAKAMALSLPSARARIKRLMASAEKYGSLINMLWHNTSFDPVDYPLWGALYWESIKLAQKRGAYVGSLDSIKHRWSHQ